MFEPCAGTLGNFEIYADTAFRCDATDLLPFLDTFDERSVQLYLKV